MKLRKKKNVKFRGSKSHGYGAKKKHRGAGSRGGRGNSGSGKMADQKKPSYWIAGRGGKKGFTSKSRTISIGVNIRDIERQIPQFVRDGRAVEKDGIVTINLTDAGFSKLLGTGTLSRKLHIIVAAASPKAVLKVKAAGGSVETK